MFVSVPIVLTVGGATVLWWVWSSWNKNLPPGPFPLPLIGTLYAYRDLKKRFLMMTHYKKDYGPITTAYLGPRRAIFLNTADLVREAFLKQGIIYADRPRLTAFEILFDGRKDIISGPYGARQQLQRKVALGALRQYASGKALENHLYNAFDVFEQHLKDNPVFLPYETGYILAYNILASMCFGKRFSTNEPFMKKVMTVQKDFEKAMASPYIFLLMSPMLKIFPSKIKKIVSKFKEVFDGYLQNTFAEHMETYDPNDLSDFTYSVIHAWKELEEDKVEKSKMKLLNKDHFKFILLDLFIAGTETTRQTLAWIFLYLAAHPKVQERAQEEIDNVIGRNEKVTVNDRESLPYIDAILHEVMRMRPVAPQGLPRRTLQDTTLAGYNIPKGSTVMINIWAIHHDENEWENPEDFKPERWLDEEGNYVFQQNGFVPFSIGRRSCIGESFAKLELHILITMTLQKYTLRVAPGQIIDLEPMPQMNLAPARQTLVATRRE